MMFQAAIILWMYVTHCIAQKKPYSTNFSSFDSTYWTLETDCGHCGNRNGDECTQFEVSAITYNSSYGAVITTAVLPKPSSCGGICSSGHMTFNENILYGTIIVKAKWFPGTASQVNTSTGFIGLDSPGNVASIVFGFHGKGWIGHNDEDFSHEFQTDLYKNESNGHNGIYVKTPNTDLADDINTYELIWTADQVVWKVNGDVKRTVTDKSIIPNITMQARLHSRSGYCNEMPRTDTFYCQFTYFQYIPPQS